MHMRITKILSTLFYLNKGYKRYCGGKYAYIHPNAEFQVLGLSRKYIANLF